MKQSIDRVAFLGIGLMGSRMARNLLAAGHSLTVWNRDKSKADSLATHGASVAASVTTAVNGASTIITMLAKRTRRRIGVFWRRRRRWKYRSGRAGDRHEF